MPAWICETCGVQHRDTPEPPEHCPICEDERQFVGWQGQRWLTPGELRATHHADVREPEPGLTGIGCAPHFAIGQRALLVEADGGNVLWDCTPLLDDDTVAAVEARGGLAAIAISHPHFHSNVVDWSHAFGDVPVYVHADDREWVMRPAPCFELWSGEEQALHGGLTLVRVGGHFTGAQVLHWSRGILLSGDIVSVAQDRRFVTFMYSYPNFIPLDAAAVNTIVAKLEPYDFDRIYGGWWGSIVRADGKNALRRSADRYLRAIGAAPG